MRKLFSLRSSALLLSTLVAACDGGGGTTLNRGPVAAVPGTVPIPGGPPTVGASAMPSTPASPGVTATPTMAPPPGATPTPTLPPILPTAIPTMPPTAIPSSTPNPAFVQLGSASNFAILAGSTVTSTGPSTVTGDVGIYPGNAITGFPPATLNGTLHLGDPVAQKAEQDLTTGFNDAVARANSPITVSGDLGGQTLAPGLYKSTSSLAVGSSDLTLDARGDANAVFIFQMASTLTVTTGRQVLLTNGAKAANVFWSVGSSATLGTFSSFVGNLLVSQSITMQTSAKLSGRALTQVGAVTLDSDTLVKPIP